MLSDRFKILKSLGEGGNASVKLVEDLKTGELLACKIMNNGPDGCISDNMVLNIDREIQTVSSLCHQNVY